MYYVYILQSQKNGRYYVGTTADVKNRLKEHNKGESKSTRVYAPWELLFKKGFNSLSEARKIEGRIKAMKSRKYLEKIIEEGTL